MQIRLTKANADAVARESYAHYRIFGRRLSFSQVVNKMVLEAIQRNPAKLAKLSKHK